MAWKQASPNRWERPVDSIDGYYAFTEKLTASLCDGREHYVVFSKLKVEMDFPDVESTLRHAWKQIRYEQPSIAATVEGMTKIYEVPGEDALKQWLASTFIVSEVSDAEELYQAIMPIKQATLYYLPRSSELVFRCHHSSIDGIGTLLFWHSYLSAVAAPMEQIKFGDELIRLSPSLEEVFGYPKEPTQEQSGKATALLASWFDNMPGIGLVSQLGTAASGRCQNPELVFPAETTEAIVKACKERGVSVSAAVQAAYVGAVARHADPKSKLGEYVTLTNIDLRSYLPEPYNSSQYAVSVYYTALPYRTNLPASYLDLAKSLHEFYRTAIKGNAEALELNGHYARHICNFSQTPEYLTSSPPKDALNSSLGVVERYVQREYGSRIRVKDFKIGIDVVMGPSLFYFYTFQDQLRLVYCFNDGFEKAEDIQTYLEEVRSILIEELLK
ncbi:hypothetical protein GGR52DRAFT_580507 [Hypoxylon sp. FL1284]|nr:hypothetical protein GGR52DRAFT_580507 [Hypoxylon sp. FL1284]